MSNVDVMPSWVGVTLSGFTLATALACLGFIINFSKFAAEARAQLTEALKMKADLLQTEISLMKDRHKDSEEISAKEKSIIKDELDKAKDLLNKTMNESGLDLKAVALGKSISDVSQEKWASIEVLLTRLKELLSMVENIDARDAELSVAIGSMALGKFNDAVQYFNKYAIAGGESWAASFSQGVAYANIRGGDDTNIASLRAYNDAIALAPNLLPNNDKAKMFGYRGAILKRLGRLVEAESDLRIAEKFSSNDRINIDIYYNLACVFALKNDRENMYVYLRKISSDQSYMASVGAHIGDYFYAYRNDRELQNLLGGIN